jgi:hypothetical protein
LSEEYLQTPKLIRVHDNPREYQHFGVWPKTIVAILMADRRRSKMQCIESMTHAPFQEYRINDGKVESRVLDFARQRKTGWTEVSPAQLSAHVKRNTKIARWLERKLGWRRLLRACVGLAPTETLTRQLS